MNLNVEQFNAKYPVGTDVVFQIVEGGEGVKTKTRSGAWDLCGHPVVQVEGFTGGVSIAHVTVISHAMAVPSPSAAPEPIEGFEVGNDHAEPVLCTGCWDKSDHDTEADNDIPVGQPVYSRRVSHEYDEWDAYCQKCAQEIAAEYSSPSATPEADNV